MDTTAEISYYLDEKMKGNGYGSYMMTFALKKAKDIGFEEWVRLPSIAVFDSYRRDHLYYGRKLASND